MNAKQIKKEITKIVKAALNQAENSLIEDAFPKEKLSAEETCEIPQAISSIKIENCSISTNLYINGKLCTNWDLL